MPVSRPLAIGALLALIGFSLLILFATETFAQEARKHAFVDTAVVVRVDTAGQRITIRDDASGAERLIAVDSSTRVQVGAEEVPLTRLEAGDRVTISARPEGATPGEVPIADLVQVVIDRTSAPGATPGVGAAPGVTVSTLRGRDGKEHGVVRIRETQAGLLVQVSLRDLPPGPHGFHAHAVGRCEPPFETAGDHLAPNSRRHGFLAAGGAHGGDLVNLIVDADGRLEQELRAPDLSMADLLDADGAAFVLHERADDYTSQPAGDAGGRIACASVGGPTASAAR